MYIDDMHDNDFVKDALDYVKGNQGEFATSKRMIGQLTACMEVKNGFLPKSLSHSLYLFSTEGESDCSFWL